MPEEKIGSIFDALGVEDPIAKKEQEAAIAKKAAEPAPDNSQFMERIAQLEGMIKGMQYQQPGQDFEKPSPAPEIQYKPGEWGDPIEEPSKFQQNLANFIENTLSAREAHRDAQAAEARAQETRSAKLWDAFQKQYPQYKENPDRVKFIAEQVVSEARESGMDIDRYMGVGKDDFIKDVANKYQTVFGDTSQPEAKSTEDDPGRTAGIFGGQESGGKAAAGSSDGPKDGDMIEDLKQIQRSMGLL